MSTALYNLERDANLYTIDDLPKSDGKPMAETHKHVLQIVAALNALRWHFRDDPLTEKWLLTHEEAQAARQIAEAQTQRELAARQAAEAEVVRLREELARRQKT